MPVSMPQNPLVAFAPFGFCIHCKENVRKYRNADEPFWRCRNCGLIMRSQPKPKKPKPRVKGLGWRGPLLHSR